MAVTLEPNRAEQELEILKHRSIVAYTNLCKQQEEKLKKTGEEVKQILSSKNTETGLAPMTQWDLPGDEQRMVSDHPLQVAQCTSIINPGVEGSPYMISIPRYAKFIVALGKRVSAIDIEAGNRVGVDRTKYKIQMPLPAKIDPTVSMMTVEEKPTVTYADIGGVKEQLEKLREVVELPLLSPERFVRLGIDPPKGVMLYGPPGTGKTLTAKAIANRTNACFICVSGSELVQKYIGEGARLVRELFAMARQKQSAILFIDEVDAIGTARDDDSGSDNEVQRTMLEILNQLDGFDARGNVKVVLATNRPDTLDPALLRPGRIDRKIEFNIPQLQDRAEIIKIHTQKMSMEKNIRFDLLARMCMNTTGAELRSICTEAGMFAIRDQRKAVSEKDLIAAIDKVVNECDRFSSTSKYSAFN